MFIQKPMDISSAVDLLRLVYLLYLERRLKFLPLSVWEN